MGQHSLLRQVHSRERTLESGIRKSIKMFYVGTHCRLPSWSWLECADTGAEVQRRPMLYCCALRDSVSVSKKGEVDACSVEAQPLGSRLLPEGTLPLGLLDTSLYKDLLPPPKP